jgi:hypothetical protein
VNFINPLLFIVLWFAVFDDPKDDVSLWREKIISTFKKHEAEKYLGYKSYKLEITDQGFVRYIRILANNKREYFSVRIDKFLELDYQGTEKSGWLLLGCEPSSVIFQTYKDPLGDVDSMTNEIVFPLNHISAEELNQLKNNFEDLKNNFVK